MYDILSDDSIYGMELTINNKFSMIFFKKAYSLQQARDQGYKLLHSLEMKFPGLTGECLPTSITDAHFEKNLSVIEVWLPNLKSTQNRSMPVLKRITYLFNKIQHHSFKFYFFWQSDDSIPGNSIYSAYKVKMFITCHPDNTDIVRGKEVYSKPLHFLDLFVRGLKNINQRPARLKKTSKDTWKNMLSFKVFWENTRRKGTGEYYRLIRQFLPEDLPPSFITPDQVDFTFIKDLPLPKMIILDRENVNFLDHFPKEYGITLGRYLNNGIPSSKEMIVSLDNFSQSTVIFGQPGTGKTNFLAHISREFYQKAKNIGIIYLNLAKGRQEDFYKVDKVLNYGSPALKIPYYVKGDPALKEKSFQETATYIIASLGLKDPVDKILFVVMNAFIDSNGELPTSSEKLFRGLKKWYLQNKYSDEYQTNILRAIENRILSLLADPTLDTTFQLLKGSKGPEWFYQWREGKKIYINLSMCNIYVKRLLTNAIFQIIRTLTPDVEAGELQNLIVIDEAHQITERAVINNPYDDDYIAREQLEKILNVLLREFRGKGLAFILADQTPHLLFNCVSTLPSLKILFRLGYQSSKLFSSDLKELELIKFQKNRQALVLNGVNAERYVIKTIDYHPEDYLEDFEEMNEGVYIENVRPKENWKVE